MLEKLKSRKFWMALISELISITVIFTKMGGSIGVIAGIIGTFLSAVSYMITEGRVDVARCKVSIEEIKTMLDKMDSDK